MNNELSIYQNISDPVSAMQVIGKAIAKSQIFGCKSTEQGEILALECLAQGTPVLSMAKRYDLMNGKLSMKSQTMLADFRTAGGDHKVVEKSADRVTIWLKDCRGHEYDFELTWEDAKKETFPYAGKESEIIEAMENGGNLTLKPKYATPRSRANMLWNRLISDAIRTIAPEINCGQYTADEIEDIAEGPIDASFVVVEDHSPEQVADASVAITEESSESKEPAKEQPKQPVNRPIEESTIERIKSAIGQAAQVGLPEIGKQVGKKLLECGFDGSQPLLQQLTEQEGQRLLVSIETKAFGEWLSNAEVCPADPVLGN